VVVVKLHRTHTPTITQPCNHFHAIFCAGKLVSEARQPAYADQSKDMIKRPYGTGLSQEDEANTAIVIPPTSMASNTQKSDKSGIILSSTY